MFGPSLRIFVSASTHDLGMHRRAVEQALLDSGIHPITQEHFRADNRTLTDFLRDEVAACDAVICLVGHVFGAAPSDRPDRSYTQLEYDFAQAYARPVFVFLTSDDFSPKAAPGDTVVQLAAQRAHREGLMRSHTCTWFGEVENLRSMVRDIVPKIRTGAGQVPIHYLYPPNQPVHFAGRGFELNQFREALRRASPSVIAVIGMAGQGKSTLVHHGLKTYARGLFATGFWWSADRDGFSFDLFLDEALGHFLQGGFDKRELPEKRQRVTRLLSLLQQRPLVLVIDGLQRWLRGWQGTDADDGSMPTLDERRGQDAEIDDLLRAASALTNGSHLILTTRALPEALDHAARTLVPVYEPEKRFALEGLDNRAAVQLLRAWSVAGTEDALIKTAQQYGMHPLALNLLGSHLKEHYGGQIQPRIALGNADPLQKFNQLIDETRRHFPQRRKAERLLGIVAHSLGPASLSAVAFCLRQLMPSWKERLRLCLFPERAERVELPESDLALTRELVVALANWQITGWDTGAQTLSLHPLVSEHFIRLIPFPREIHRNLAAWYASQSVPENASTLDHMRSRRLAVEHALRAGDMKWCARLMFELVAGGYTFSGWLDVWGHQSFAIELLHRLAAASEGELRADFLLARSAHLHQLSRGHESLADSSAAIKMIAKPGAPHSLQSNTTLAKAFVNRGNVHRDIGRSSDALSDYERALAIFQARDLLDVEAQIDIAHTTVNHANALLDLGHWSRARSGYDIGCADYERLLLFDPQRLAPNLAMARMNRGIVLTELGEDRLALADFTAAISGLQRCVENGRRELASRLAHVHITTGTKLSELGRNDEAAAEIDAALHLLDPLLAASRKDVEPLVALAYMDRAQVRLEQRRLDVALEDAHRAAAIYERFVIEGHEQYTGSLAHVRIIRAEIQFRLGAMALSAEDRTAGFAQLRELMRKWSGESDVEQVFLRKATAAVQYLWNGARDECGVLLSQLGELCEGYLRDPSAAEALRKTSERCLAKLLPLRTEFVAAGFDLKAFEQLPRESHPAITLAVAGERDSSSVS